jgi:hypothetical protein
VGDTSEIRELIRAAAEGATGGVAALRAAGIPAALSGFTVEIDYAGGTPPGPEVGAVVRLSIVAAEGDGGPTLASPAAAGEARGGNWSGG